MALLRPASDLERLARASFTIAAWGEGLSLPQYQARETRLSRHPWPQQALTSWLYLDNDQRTVLSSCETYRMPSFIGEKAGLSWGVASVFTEESMRGRGYGSAMLAQLGEHLSREPNAQAAFLFSDIGETMYRALGYTFVAPGYDYVFPATPHSLPNGLQWLQTLAPCTLNLAPCSLNSFNFPLKNPQALYVQPTPQQLDWHLERERRAPDGSELPPPAAIGAQLPGEGGGSVFWVIDARKQAPELILLWLQAATAEASHRLVSVAQQAAYSAGLTQVRVWEGMASDLASLTGSQRVARKGKLAMMKPLQAHISSWRGVQRGLWV